MTSGSADCQDGFSHAHYKFRDQPLWAEGSWVQVPGRTQELRLRGGKSIHTDHRGLGMRMYRHAQIRDRDGPRHKVTQRQPEIQNAVFDRRRAEEAAGQVREGSTGLSGPLLLTVAAVRLGRFVRHSSIRSTSRALPRRHSQPAWPPIRPCPPLPSPPGERPGSLGQWSRDTPRNIRRKIPCSAEESASPHRRRERRRCRRPCRCGRSSGC